MKTLLTKIARVVVAISVPVLIMASCESDLIEPENAIPPKTGIKIPIGHTE